MRANDPNLPDLRRIAEALGELRQAVATAFAPLLVNQNFVNVLPGLIAEPERAAIVMKRLRSLSE